MDAFMEKIVRHTKTPAERLKVAGILVAAVVLSFVVTFVLPNVPLGATIQSLLSMLSPFLFAGVCFGAWWLITGMSVEYEYIVTNMDLDIDRIVAKRKRKRVLSVKSKDFEICAKRNGPHYKEYAKGSYAVLDYAGRVDSPDCWFAVVVVDGKRSLLLFEPDDRMVQTFRRFAPNKVKYD